MALDELNAPLTGPPPPAARPALRLVGVWAVRLAVLGGAGALTAAYMLRPAPTQVAAAIPFADIVTVAPPETATPTPSAPSSVPEAADSGAGVFVRSGGPTPANLHMPKIIDVAEALGQKLSVAPDKRLVEPSKYGVLPRIGADGARPSQVYARPAPETALTRRAPRIAVFVGGLGLNPETTEAALAKLPAPVSLGIAPYGDDLAKVADSARAAGHEIWLQAPMEPVAGPDPGPHTLKSGAGTAENLENLHWLMGRFAGYVGVASYLGGRYAADEAALSPTLTEIARRGLIYLDDGGAPLSKAVDLAAGLDLRASRADVFVDADASPEAALARAEDFARRHGTAIVVATALPRSLDALVRWTAALQGKGFAFEPVSALVGARRDRAATAEP